MKFIAECECGATLRSSSIDNLAEQVQVHSLGCLKAEQSLDDMSKTETKKPFKNEDLQSILASKKISKEAMEAKVSHLLRETEIPSERNQSRIVYHLLSKELFSSIETFFRRLKSSESSEIELLERAFSSCTYANPSLATKNSVEYCVRRGMKLKKRYVASVKRSKDSGKESYKGQSDFIAAIWTCQTQLRTTRQKALDCANSEVLREAVLSGIIQTRRQLREALEKIQEASTVQKPPKRRL